MGFASWMAYRYLTARKDKFLSVINGVAVAGIAIGVAALIVVIGVMSGFDHELREKIIGANAHVLVERETGLEQYAALQDKLKVLPGVMAATSYIHGNVFLESGRKAASLILRGVDPKSEGFVTKIDRYLGGHGAIGKIADLKPDEAVIGSQMASFYGLRVGDDMTIIAPASGMAGDAWRYHFKVAGLFTSGMYDYDRNLVLVDLRKAQEIFHIGPDTVTGIGLKLRDPQAAGVVKKNIYDLAGFSFSVRTWMESNSNFFAALQLEKFAMFIILILIVLVASFNIISTLIVTVTGKVRDICILKAIGASKGTVGRLFMWQGLAVGMLGTFWGFTGGGGLGLLLKKYQFIRLPQDIYYIDHLPVLVQASDVAVIVAAAMLITYAATVYPAMKAADLEPVEALRY